MKLVNAKCPICGGTLKVDSEKDAAICEYCGNAFVVEKAIENYNQTIQNQTINNSGTINVENVHIHQEDPVKQISIDKLTEMIHSSLFETKDYNLAEKYIDELLERDLKNCFGLYCKGWLLFISDKNAIGAINYLLTSYKNAGNLTKKQVCSYFKGEDFPFSELLINVMKCVLQYNPVMDSTLYGQIGFELEKANLLKKLYCKVEVNYETNIHINFIFDGFQFSNMPGNYSVLLLKQPLYKHTICNPWNQYNIKENLGVLSDDINHIRLTVTRDERAKCFDTFIEINGGEKKLFIDGHQKNKGGFLGWLLG